MLQCAAVRCSMLQCVAEVEGCFSKNRGLSCRGLSNRNKRLNILLQTYGVLLQIDRALLKGYWAVSYMDTLSSWVLQCAAVGCRVLQFVAVCCSVLVRRRLKATDETLSSQVVQCVAVYCRVLQGVAECCRVLQSVAECCSVLWCVTAC